MGTGDPARCRRGLSNRHIAASLTISEAIVFTLLPPTRRSNWIYYAFAPSLRNV